MNQHYSKKHQNFKTVVKDFKAPVTSESKPPQSIANIDMKKLKKLFKARMTPIFGEHL